MKELVELLVKALVDDPSAVEVTEVEERRSVLYEVRVAPDEMGRVIGRQGKIINALRTVVKAASTKDDLRVSVELVS
jgi:predicted RNA-binding protein YlqC (UPF0109 family)